MSKSWQAGRARPVASALIVDTSGLAVAVRRYDHQDGWTWTPHQHAAHQLLWSPTGPVRVECDAESWLLPPSLTFWIPGGVEHAVVGREAEQVYCLYLDAAGCPVDHDRPAPMIANDIVVALIKRLANVSLSDAQRARTEAVLFDTLTPVSVRRVGVELPTEPRLRCIAEALLVDPADVRDLACFGDLVGASPRTLSRLFLSELGITFGEFRREIRLRAALDLLADGHSVKQVARKTGYRSASAFVQSFRRATGHTPGAWLNRERSSRDAAR